jgi:hypothetical protein
MKDLRKILLKLISDYQLQDKKLLYKLEMWFKW